MKSLFLAFSVLHLLLLAWSITFPNTKLYKLRFLQIMILGMIYDNIIQYSGSYLIHSQWFELLSRFRYFFHAITLPFLTIFSLSILQESNIQWSKNTLIICVFWVFATLSLIYGLYYDVFLLEIELKSILDNAKYVSLSNTLPLATIATNIVVLLIAAAVWQYSRWSVFFFATLFIFLINAAFVSSQFRAIIGNFAELLFIFSLLLTTRHFSIINNSRIVA